MKKQKNSGFLSSKINFLFSLLGKLFIVSAQILALKFADLISKFHDVREKSKNLLETNLDVAEEHLKNNNFFDAKLRYRIVLKMDPTNLKAMMGLGFIFLSEKDEEKAKYFFNKALEGEITEKERAEIESILFEINNKKQAI